MDRELINRSIRFSEKKQTELAQNTSQDSWKRSLLKTWSDSGKLLAAFSPTNKELCRDEDRIFDRDQTESFPSLNRIRLAFGAETSETLVFLHLKDFCNAEGIKNYNPIQMQDIGEVITSEYGFINVGELAVFFRKLKAGKYGRTFGNSLQCTAITGALNEFLAYRSREIDRIEQRKREAERNKLFEIKEQTDQKQ